MIEVISTKTLSFAPTFEEEITFNIKIDGKAYTRESYYFANKGCLASFLLNAGNTQAQLNDMALDMVKDAKVYLEKEQGQYTNGEVIDYVECCLDDLSIWEGFWPDHRDMMLELAKAYL